METISFTSTHKQRERESGREREREGGKTRDWNAQRRNISIEFFMTNCTINRNIAPGNRSTPHKINKMNNNH